MRYLGTVEFRDASGKVVAESTPTYHGLRWNRARAQLAALYKELEECHKFYGDHIKLVRIPG